MENIIQKLRSMFSERAKPILLSILGGHNLSLVDLYRSPSEL